MGEPTFFSYVLRSFLQDAGLVLALMGCALSLVVFDLITRPRVRGITEDKPQTGRRFPRASLTAVALLIVAMALLAGLSCDGAARLLARPLVAKSLPERNGGAPCSPRASALVVLSGGIESSSMPSVDTLLRVESAAALAASEAQSGQPYRLIVLSGGKTDPAIDTSEAAVMRGAFLRLLSNPDSLNQRGTEVVTEEQSLTTYENATFTRALFRERKIDPQIELVTSAEHMLRSRLTFEAQGFEVCPRPAMPRRFRAIRLFSFRQAGQATAVVHEWLGLAGYALSGRL